MAYGVMWPTYFHHGICCNGACKVSSRCMVTWGLHSSIKAYGVMVPMQFHQGVWCRGACTVPSRYMVSWGMHSSIKVYGGMHSSIKMYGISGIWCYGACTGPSRCLHFPLFVLTQSYNPGEKTSGGRSQPGS